MIEELKNCRVCGSEDLEIILDLGKIFPSGFVAKGQKLSKKDKAPLVLCKCGQCELVQLKHTINLDLMYRQYWYSSSLNKSMVGSLQEIIDDIVQKVSFGVQDIVVDIGCNDGTMLNLYPEDLDIKKIGFDPALNLKKPEGIHFINDYFSTKPYNDLILNSTIFGSHKAKIITAIAMFYDLPNPLEFTKDVASILDDDGVFVIQFTDLLSMFKASAFDNICHEHLEYYTLRNVVEILLDAGLRVIDVSYNDVNGASVRVTATHMHSSLKTEDRVIDYLVEEFKYFQEHDFQYFIDKIQTCKDKLTEFLNWAKSRNELVHLMGASTKGNTLLQVCEITKNDIPYAAEVNKDKFGLYTIGSDICIIPEEESLAMKPNYYLVPVWHFRDSLVNNPKIFEYLENGGSLVMPLPYFTIIKSDGEFKL